MDKKSKIKKKRKAFVSQASEEVVSMDKESWSESSKNSFSYESCQGHYENIQYRCFKCKREAVYTAKQQKQDYEVKKAYIWQKRALCEGCYVALHALKQRLAEFEGLWAKENESTKDSASYIKDWVSCMELMPSYGKPINQGMVASLTKRINKNA